MLVQVCLLDPSDCIVSKFTLSLAPTTVGSSGSSKSLVVAEALVALQLRRRIFESITCGGKNLLHFAVLRLTNSLHCCSQCLTHSTAPQFWHHIHLSR
ncbi:hypothetical protein Pcinc_021489 [Petrolisthes cinctipes]|uniref:Uncharacterized protein n=1 Tax=Petrolisthes cinctipes TaxID=88211 RepID=A0AAE1FHB9_PETCI|nr:hypothetical protein Pcinc_021489 [Petrolisthes cinctipes]